jgi:hypothetical protein
VGFLLLPTDNPIKSETKQARRRASCRVAVTERATGGVEVTVTGVVRSNCRRQRGVVPAQEAQVTSVVKQHACVG